MEELTMHLLSPLRTACSRGEQYRALLGSFVSSGSWKEPKIIGTNILGYNKMTFRLPFFIPMIPDYDVGAEPELGQRFHSLSDAMEFRLSHGGPGV